MKISNKLYDILKWVVIIVLPAMATLYKALSAVCAWPYANEVVTTITAVDTFRGAVWGIAEATFLGAVLCISAATYNYNKEDGVNA